MWHSLDFSLTFFLNLFEEATETFKRLGNMPETISDDDRLILEQFVVLLYDRSSAVRRVNEARLDLFAHKQVICNDSTYLVSAVRTYKKSDIPCRPYMGPDSNS